MSLKKFKSYYHLVLTVLICSASVCTIKAQSCDSLTGRWINQDSSIFHVVLETDGTLRGHYQSNASDDSTLFDFQGWVNRAHDLTTLSFAVSWGDFGSITSWTGFCQEEEGIPTITTMWHLVRPYVAEDWERMLTNKSMFRPLDE